MTKKEIENKIDWSRKRQVIRLEAQLKYQEELGNKGRAEMLKDKINKLKTKNK